MDTIVIPHEVIKAIRKPQEADGDLLTDISQVLKMLTGRQEQFVGLYSMGFEPTKVVRMMDLEEKCWTVLPSLGQLIEFIYY